MSTMPGTPAMPGTTQGTPSDRAENLSGNGPATQPLPQQSGGLRFTRVFSTEGVSPYDQVTWETRTAEIVGNDGKPVFRQEGVEVPASWSERATAIVFDKYAYGRLGTPERETSVHQIVDRVVSAIYSAGIRWGYFASQVESLIFADELAWLLLNQHAAFNSPVWFNVGCRPGHGYAWDFNKADVVNCDDLYEAGDFRYQGSACFIIGVEDSIDSISRNAATEMAIFKYGSGAGSDRSRLRSSREPVTGGGRASGPVSFMRIYDAVGAVTKSGGISRRAAKMEILRCDHPDIMEFIQCKRLEEQKAKALIAAGYEADFNGEAYNSVLFQNSNLSVRATDAFLRAVEADEEWQTLSVTTGKPEAADGSLMPTYKACEIMDAIAEGTWQCGDPGMQYDDTIQRWHTIPNAGRLHASNPCSEYMSIDDSACNLASLNLMKFRRPDGTFDVARFRAACRIFAVAQDILVDLGSYPTPEIARNAHRFRQLGLGFANLGSLIMAAGLPYDSDEGRSLAGAITAIMTGQVYLTSAEMAGTEGLGAFDGFAVDRENMLRVMKQHRHALRENPVMPMWFDAYKLWNDVVEAGEEHGYRNSQATVLAPTGTIAFMMDCSTTGIEPAIALVSYKTLWGRGRLKLVNDTVSEALRVLGYEQGAIKEILQHVEKHDTIEEVAMNYGPDDRYQDIVVNPLKPEHLPVFDCAFPPANGSRSIHWRGHLKMVAAVQPWLSGAASKTINMPRDSTVADIRAAYLEGWKLGLKAVAIYRDGSKDSQPVSTSKGDQGDDRRGNSDGVVPGHVGDQRGSVGDGSLADDLGVLPDPCDQQGNHDVQGMVPRRERLPDTRQSLTHKGTVGGVEFYLTVGLYPDGRPGEIFCEIAKQGSTVGGLMDAWATMFSIVLQYGVPLEVLVRKFSGGRFEPAGITRNPDIPFAASLIDYIARWIGMQYVPGYREQHAPQRHAPPPTSPLGSQDLPAGGLSDESVVSLSRSSAPVNAGNLVAHAPTCTECGGLCQPSGACWTCTACGTSQGGCG